MLFLHRTLYLYLNIYISFLDFEYNETLCVIAGVRYVYCKCLPEVQQALFHLDVLSCPETRRDQNART